MANRKTVKIGGFEIGAGKPLALIAGPCVIESADSALRHAAALKQIADRAGVPFVFKSSYDKANRTSLESFRGPGVDEGLKILAKVRREIGVPRVTAAAHTRQMRA